MDISPGGDIDTADHNGGELPGEIKGKVGHGHQPKVRYAAHFDVTIQSVDHVKAVKLSRRTSESGTSSEVLTKTMMQMSLKDFSNLHLSHNRATHTFPFPAFSRLKL